MPNDGKTSGLYVARVCVVAALGGLLFGYDTGVIAGAIGFLETHFNLDPSFEKGWIAASALVGCTIGVSIAGLLSDFLGRKRTLIVAAVLFFISALGTALPKNVTMFVIFRIIGGVGVGAASITSPMYIAEISPARIRGRMVSVNQFAIVTGFLVVYLVNYFIALQGTDAWNVAYGWRWMFGSEALPAFMLLVLLFFVPESPRWLTKYGRHEKALAVLSRVGTPANAKQQLESIKDAIAHESGSLAQLLKPGMRIVLMIGIVLAVLQQVTGINVFLYFGAEIFRKMGSGINAALLKEVIVGAVNLTFTIIAIWTVDRLGRKPLMLIGSAGMGICDGHVAADFHSRLYRVLCPVGRAGDVGDPFGDIPDENSRPCNGSSYGISVAGELSRDADFHDDGREFLANREVSSRLSFLGLRRFLRLFARDKRQDT